MAFEHAGRGLRRAGRCRGLGSHDRQAEEGAIERQVYASVHNKRVCKDDRSHVCLSGAQVDSILQPTAV